jgi:hypothetical protein
MCLHSILCCCKLLTSCPLRILILGLLLLLCTQVVTLRWSCWLAPPVYGVQLCPLPTQQQRAYSPTAEWHLAILSQVAGSLYGVLDTCTDGRCIVVGKWQTSDNSLVRASQPCTHNAYPAGQPRLRMRQCSRA